MNAEIITVIIAAALWAWILPNWRRGFYVLLVFLPVIGFVSLRLYPAVWPRLLKDVLFVAPCYLGFLVAEGSWHNKIAIPRAVIIPLALFSFVVLIQTFNPSEPNWRVAAIGVKVWLFYLPFIFLGNAFFSERTAARSIWRYMVLLTLLPCIIGLTQWLGCFVFGYAPTMKTFYGAAAYAATQGFTLFTIGSWRYFRIPSTFTYVTQYLNFLISMLIPAYILWRTDPQTGWRRFGMMAWFLIILASYLSGARSAYVIVTSLAILIIFLDRGLKPALLMALTVLPILFATLLLPELATRILSRANNQPVHPPVTQSPQPQLKTQTRRVHTPNLQTRTVIPPVPVPKSEITLSRRYELLMEHQRDLGFWLKMMGSLIVDNPVDLGYTGFKESLVIAPWGKGTGTNTGAARYAYSDPGNPDTKGPFESYYAKIVYELGIPGFLCLIWFYGSIVSVGLSIRRHQASNPPVRTIASTILALVLVILVYSLKGWAIDLDPLNLYFWLFVGILLSLSGSAQSVTQDRHEEALVSRTQLPSAT